MVNEHCIFRRDVFPTIVYRINTVVQVFFVFTTYVTFLIEFYVAMTIIEPPVFRWVKKWQPESKLVMISYTIRVGCVILLGTFLL